MQLAFEPVGERYEEAKNEYRKGLTSKIASDDSSSLTLQRYHFGTCVAILRELYSAGRVEQINGLPFPLDIVFDFNKSDLENLAISLSELYFPGYKPELLEKIKYPVKKRYHLKPKQHHSSSRKGNIVVKLD